MRGLYSTLMSALVPLLMARMLWRSVRAPDYRRRLAERLGLFNAELPPGRSESIWIHAVSLGETLAARPLIEALLDQRPDCLVIVTTTTPTGSEQVRRLFGDRVFHVYAPWDTSGAVRRFLAKLRPELLVLIETELWPNMLHWCARSQCKVLLANARLSARSAAGYARIGNLTQQMLECVDCIAAQSGADASRFIELGARESNTHVIGSLKFDVQLSDEQRDEANRLKTLLLSNRRALIVASTHRGEDQLALEVFRDLREKFPELTLLLAPRHPERFDEVARLIESFQPDWTMRRRSEDADGTPGFDVLLIDTLGELLLLFGVTDLAVIGGSFVEHGGHNPLEAAVWGVPTLVGPHMFNFAEVSQRLESDGGLVTCRDRSAVVREAMLVLTDSAEYLRRQRSVIKTVASNQGALSALIDDIDRLLQSPSR